jgi:hypothetical protein
MTLTTTLPDAARALNVTPAAIRRAVPYHDPATPLPLSKIVTAFNLEKNTLIRALDGEDSFLTIAEAAEFLETSVTNVSIMKRYGQIEPDAFWDCPAPCHRVIRFSREKLAAFKKTRESGRAA